MKYNNTLNVKKLKINYEKQCIKLQIQLEFYENEI